VTTSPSGFSAAHDVKRSGKTRQRNTGWQLASSSDGWERDAASGYLAGHLKTSPIARRQDISLAVAAAFPVRADGVDDMAYRWVLIECRRGDRVAWLAWCQRSTRLGRSGPGRTMNGPIHTATAQQRLIRCGNDGIDVLAGDVTKNNFDLRHGPMMPRRASRAVGRRRVWSTEPAGPTVVAWQVYRVSSPPGSASPRSAGPTCIC
jgi:hypothetical protein